MNGKYSAEKGFGGVLRTLERSRERAATATPVLWVSASADDPPPNGEVLWYRPDLTCGP